MYQLHRSTNCLKKIIWHSSNDFGSCYLLEAMTLNAEGDSSNVSQSF